MKSYWEKSVILFAIFFCFWIQLKADVYKYLLKKVCKKPFCFQKKHTTLKASKLYYLRKDKLCNLYKGNTTNILFRPVENRVATDNPASIIDAFIDQPASGTSFSFFKLFPSDLFAKAFCTSMQYPPLYKNQSS